MVVELLLRRRTRPGVRPYELELLRRLQTVVVRTTQMTYLTGLDRVEGSDVFFASLKALLDLCNANIHLRGLEGTRPQRQR